MAWNNLAESCKNVLAKGYEAIVIGSIKEDSWTDKEGVTRKTVEVTSSSIAVSTFAVQRAAKQSAPVQERQLVETSSPWD